MIWAALPPLAMYLLVGVAAFAGALALYELIRRIPILRWCVCGIGGTKECLIKPNLERKSL